MRKGFRSIEEPGRRGVPSLSRIARGGSSGKPQVAQIAVPIEEDEPLSPIR